MGAKPKTVRKIELKGKRSFLQIRCERKKGSEPELAARNINGSDQDPGCPRWDAYFQFSTRRVK